MSETKQNPFKSDWQWFVLWWCRYINYELNKIKRTVQVINHIFLAQPIFCYWNVSQTVPNWNDLKKNVTHCVSKISFFYCLCNHTQFFVSYLCIAPNSPGRIIFRPFVLIACFLRGLIYYSKFAKDQLFDIAYFSPIANYTPVRGPHYCILKLSICHVQLALVICYSFKSIFICITNTQK